MLCPINQVCLGWWQLGSSSPLSCTPVATAALKRKKASEQELDRLAGTRLQLEMQVNTLESANLNAETMAAMKKAADALKVIHGNMCAAFLLALGPFSL